MIGIRICINYVVVLVQHFSCYVLPLSLLYANHCLLILLVVVGFVFLIRRVTREERREQKLSLCDEEVPVE